MAHATTDWRHARSPRSRAVDRCSEPDHDGWLVNVGDAVRVDCNDLMCCTRVVRLRFWVVAERMMQMGK